MFNSLIFRCVFLVVFSLTILSSVVVASPDVLSAQSATLDVSFNLPISFDVEEDDGFLSYLDVEFMMIPLNNFRQSVVTSNYNFEPVSFENEIPTFTFKSTEDVVLEADFLVETTASHSSIDDKVSFPIEGLDPGFSDYVSSSNVYDINDDIEELAVELSAGEDDLFMVVFNLANWVNDNVEYDLSTLSPDTLTASWVLENKVGVCTEYTSLFIALARSLGIPAREVSGFAFTQSSLFDEPWEFHSWAEVYFPGFGWVVFDPTFGQFGFVDAGHVSLTRKNEGELVRNSFSWKGSGVNVLPEDTSLNVDVVSTSPSHKSSNLDVKSVFLEDEVGFSSYNFLRIDLVNNNDYYVAESIRVSGIDGISFLSERKLDVALAPFESKSVYFVFKVDDSLKDNFIYTFPLKFYINDDDFSAKFKVQRGMPSVSIDDVSPFLERDDVSVGNLDCDVTPVVRVGDSLNINCSDVFGEGTLCINNDDCEVISESDSLNLSFKASKPGLFSKPVIFEAQNHSRSGFVKFLVLDNVSIDLSQSNHSESLSPSDEGFINLSLVKNSSAVPKNVTLKIKHEYFEEEVSIGNLSDEFLFSFSYPARNLRKGDNEIIVEVLFQDDLGTHTSQSLNLNVVVDNLSLLDEIDFFLRKIYFWIKQVVH